MEISQELIESLKKDARRGTWMEDPEGFDPMGCSGGNYDDAYYGGEADGQTNMARFILEGLGIDWK